MTTFASTTILTTTEPWSWRQSERQGGHLSDRMALTLQAAVVRACQIAPALASPYCIYMLLVPIAIGEPRGFLVLHRLKRPLVLRDQASRCSVGMLDMTFLLTSGGVPQCLGRTRSLPNTSSPCINEHTGSIHRHPSLSLSQDTQILQGRLHFEAHLI